MSKPLIIAGPCAAESEQQVMTTAASLKQFNVDFFRAGLWKPRTSPHSFQGVGAKGIKWLVNVREKYGLKVATEVATPQHVALCRDAGLDALWIGARTVSDPFAVQALSEYLMGYEGTVMVKNPISDDVDLWEGAIQRLQLMGISNIVAIHRGVKTSVYHPTGMRNKPEWSMPIELRRRMPQIPIICDPSHITGNAQIVPQVAQQAVSLGLEGLMVEVHCEPAKALSDRMQQLTPQQFGTMIAGLNFRQQSKAEQNLLQLREQIDEIDNQIWQLIEHRMDISARIGEIKHQQGLPVFQPERYQNILQQRLQWAQQHQLPEQLVNDIMQALHNASVQKQL